MSVDYAPLLLELQEHGNLSKACRDLGIVRTTFLDAVERDSDLADKYARAKSRGIDATMEELLDADITDPATSRLEWDRKRWHASKLFPRQYGDKLDVTSGGEKLNWSERAAAARERSE